MPDSIPRKTCSRCKKEKPVSEFPKEPRMRDGYRSQCKQCRNAYKADRYHSDPTYREKMKVRSRNIARQNPERNRERARQWAIEHREHVLERAKRQWHERTDKAKYKAKRNKRRKELYRIDTEFRERRKRDSRHSAKIRKVRMKGIPGSYTQREWSELCEKFDHRCVCCRQKKPLTVDHVVPISKQGTNNISNIQPLCIDCNLHKGTQTTDYR